MTRTRVLMALLSLASASMGIAPAHGAAGRAGDRPPAAVRGAKSANYLPLRLVDDGTGSKVPAGWQNIRPGEWVAAPGDPASPRMVRIVHATPVTSPTAAFAEVSTRAGLKPFDVHSQEVGTWNYLSKNEASRAWGTAAGAQAGGVEQALFAATFHNSDTGQWITELYTAPVDTYRRWGGVMTLLDNFGMMDHIEGLPAGFPAAAARASYAEQAEIFATLIDVTVTRVAMGTNQAMQGALDTLRAIGRDIDLRTSCQMAANCSYSHGGTPGTGSASYGPG